MSSTSVLSSASNATVNVFDTISNTATAATKLINGMSTGANLFERMMNDMDVRHAMRSKLDHADYERELLSSYAEKISSRDRAYQRRIAEDPAFAKSFAENYAELQALLNPAVSE